MLKEIVTDEYINNQLQTFNLTNSAIEELDKQYMSLKINDHEDKNNYKIVKDSRRIIKNYRINVEKRRKELTTDALKFQRAINEEAKRIISLLEPIESHLLRQEEFFESENERIKLEKEAIEKEKLKIKKQERSKKLESIGFIFSFLKGGFSCEYDDFILDELTFTSSEDSVFDLIIEQYQKKYSSYMELKIAAEIAEKEKLKIQEAERKKQEELLEKNRKLEEEKLIQKNKEMEEEAQKLKSLVKHQEENILKMKQEKIDSEKLIISNSITDSNIEIPHTEIPIFIEPEFPEVPDEHEFISEDKKNTLKIIDDLHRILQTKIYSKKFQEKTNFVFERITKINFILKELILEN